MTLLVFQNCINQNDIKYEDACALGNDIAVVADGATGFHKKIVDGKIIHVPDVTQESYSSARVWAELLSKHLCQEAENHEIGLVQALKNAIHSASHEMQSKMTRPFEKYETPSAPVLAVRISKGMFEAVGSGDCGLVVKFADNALDVWVGNPVLDKIRQARSQKIAQQYPGLKSLSKQEQALVQFPFMKETRKTLGDPEKGYYVPFYQGEEAMEAFLKTLTQQEDKHHQRLINLYSDGNIWEYFAPAAQVKSCLLSTDGFIERAFKQNLITASKLALLMEDKDSLQELSTTLRKKEIFADNDQNAMTMKIINGRAAKTGSADDMLALFYTVHPMVATQPRIPIRQIYEQHVLQR